jgi:hypothetical protein
MPESLHDFRKLATAALTAKARALEATRHLETMTPRAEAIAEHERKREELARFNLFGQFDPMPARASVPSVRSWTGSQHVRAMAGEAGERREELAAPLGEVQARRSDDRAAVKARWHARGLVLMGGLSFCQRPSGDGQERKNENE